MPADTFDPQAQPNQGLPGGLILLGVLGLIAAVYWTFRPQQPAQPAATPRAITARGDLAADEKSTIELFRHASPSVVYITTTALQRDIFSRNLLEIPRGTGSGFIWDELGHVVTNFHVIKDANRAKVMLSDQTAHNARLVGVAPDKDLAVLRIDASSEKLRPIPVGTSNDLEVGQKVFAIGNPFGLDHTLTTGVISGLGRQIQSVSRRPIEGVIQTDAAINPGNSGGPLLDSAGRLIGVNTAIASPSGAYAGVGFAVPVDTVNRFVPDLIEHGKIDRPGLGVAIAEQQINRRLKIRGALVLRVSPDSPAAKAGLRPTRYNQAGRLELGDIIVRIDEEEITSGDDLIAALQKHAVGDRVKLTIYRGEQALEVEVALGPI